MIAAALMISAVSPAVAAPTCQTSGGQTVKCGAPGAMPAGWTLPPQERRQSEAPATVAQLLGALCALGVFFALLALMPDFDGSQPEGWDKEEGEIRAR